MVLQNLLLVLQLLLCLTSTTLQSPVQGHITTPQTAGRAVLRVGEGSIDQKELYAAIPSKTSITSPATTSAPLFIAGLRRRQHTSTTTTSWPFTLFGDSVPEATSVPSKRAITAQPDIKCDIAGYASR